MITRDNYRGAVDIIRAYVDGKKIQWAKRAYDTGWHDLGDGVPTWNFEEYVYRVKPDKPPKTTPSPSNLRALAQDTLDKLSEISHFPCDRCLGRSTYHKYLPKRVADVSDEERGQLHLLQRVCGRVG